MNYLTENQELCTQEPPSNITFYSSPITGTFTASCDNCKFATCYWECCCELIHECENN